MHMVGPTWPPRPFRWYQGTTNPPGFRGWPSDDYLRYLTYIERKPMHFWTYTTSRNGAIACCKDIRVQPPNYLYKFTVHSESQLLVFVAVCGSSL
jgi:hypothetical protein